MPNPPTTGAELEALLRYVALPPLKLAAGLIPARRADDDHCENGAMR
jgi:hypothetical protein